MRVRARRDFRKLARDGLKHPGLTPQAEYFVLEVDSMCYRIVNKRGEPVLYPKELFEVLDRCVPGGWEFRECEDDDFFLAPASTARPGFYEDWHGSDGDRAAQASAREVLRDELLRAAAGSGASDQQLIEDALARLMV